MKIGIISDTHSRQENVRLALGLLGERGVELVLHCGDIEDGETVRLFQDVPTHFVLGNCDSDEADLRRAFADTGATLHDHFGQLELAGRKVAWMHGHNVRLFRDVEHSGHFDYLFYGHSHHAERHRTGPTLVVNPGALHRARPKSFAVLDLTTGEVETVTVP